MIDVSDREPRPIVPSNWEFDAVAFAHELASVRLSRGWSTRELSRRAGISQPYVVALERPREAGAARTPTPAIDVVARLADALGIGVDRLVATALRRSSRHVVLVLDTDHRHPLSHVQEFAGDDSCEWVWASSTAGDRPRAAAHRIDLRRNPDGAYHPDRIAASLRSELQSLGDGAAGRRLGLVFPETSKVMGSIDDPGTVLDFERGWGGVVTDAVASVDSHATWNVCVYDITALRNLGEPVAATVQLIRDHDAVWSAGRTRHATGRSAATHVLERLRPAGVDPSTWTDHVQELVEALDLAA